MRSAQDIVMIPDSSGTVEFGFRGALDDCGLLLFQRLFLLLLASGDRPYSGGYGGLGIQDMLSGANALTDDALQAVMSLQCASALDQLDDGDRRLVDSFQPEVSDGHVTCILELSDGTSIRGDIE